MPSAAGLVELLVVLSPHLGVDAFSVLIEAGVLVLLVPTRCQTAGVYRRGEGVIGLLPFDLLVFSMAHGGEGGGGGGSLVDVARGGARAVETVGSDVVAPMDDGHRLEPARPA